MPKWISISLAVLGALITLAIPTGGAIFYFGQLDSRITTIENDKGMAIAVTLQHLANMLEELDDQQKILTAAMHSQNIRNARFERPSKN